MSLIVFWLREVVTVVGVVAEVVVVGVRCDDSCWSTRMRKDPTPVVAVINVVFIFGCGCCCCCDVIAVAVIDTVAVVAVLLNVAHTHVCVVKGLSDCVIGVLSSWR